MRLLLVGPPSARARARAALAGRGSGPASIEIVGEFATLADARRSSLLSSVDALLLAPAGEIFRLDDERTLQPRRGEVGDEVAAEALTGREQQVLDLLAEGLPNKAIALRLGISDQTVKFHVASICGKLGASNRTEAVRRAIRRGLITL